MRKALSSIVLAAVIASASGCGIEGRPRSPRTPDVGVASVVVWLPDPTPSPAPAQSPQTADRGPRVAEKRVDGEIEWPWISIADCESGDGPEAAGPPYHPQWGYHGGTYDGGLNFAYSTWDDAFALARSEELVPDVPSRDAWTWPARVQVDVAKRWLKATSWAQWPVCSRVVGVR